MTAADLKSIRKRAGLTQADLAAIIGVRLNTVSRWEQGVREISEAMGRLIVLSVRSIKIT